MNTADEAWTPLASPREICPDLSPQVEAVVMRLVERDPEQRYATADAALADLPTMDGRAELVALMRELKGEMPHPLFEQCPVRDGSMLVFDVGNGHERGRLTRQARQLYIAAIEE